MLSRQLGFTSSWKMLTQERGWIKPICVLALLWWIPILGQIVVLGYALEWARSTAWGIDTAPRRHNIDIGKILKTGGRAYLITLLMNLVIGVVFEILGFGSLATIASLLVFGPTSVVSAILDGAVSFTFGGLVEWILQLVVDTFLTAAVMRATLYDSFGAGWRIDRLFQMIGRDPGGFLRTCLATFIGDLVSAAYTVIVAIVGSLLAFRGITDLITSYGYHHSYSSHMTLQLLSWGAGSLILVAIVVIVAMYVYMAISVAMKLVSVNTVGQWFCRFEVERWGVSADPLPDGVPVRSQRNQDRPTGNGTPTRPAGGASAASAGSGAGASSGDGASYWDNDDPVVHAATWEPAGANKGSSDSKPNNSGSNDSAPDGPEPGGSVPSNPEPSGSAPSNPEPNDSAPSNPASSDSAPSDQESNDSAPSNPKPSGSAPSDSDDTPSAPGASNTGNDTSGPILLGPVEGD